MNINQAIQLFVPKSENSGENARFFERPERHEWYLDVALAIARRSNCLRSAYAAIVVKDDRIISTGVNGSPRGTESCYDIGECRREGSKTRENYHLCRATGAHAEMNSLVQCPSDIRRADVYLAGFSRITHKEKIWEEAFPCLACYRIMRNAGIQNVWTRNTNGKAISHSIEWFEFLED